MKRIDTLQKLGEVNLTDDQANELRALAVAAHGYERSQYAIPPPQTLEGVIELAMFQRRLKQKDLAKLLGMGESKLSGILNRKRPADVQFLKAAHAHLGIDGNTLLRYA